ncbi:hypothetical protein CFB82_34625 [Burkholderia sp. HI2714]|nr:hypothetical protein CFB82_34625 [Burkholderia sp. HI2714]
MPAGQYRKQASDDPITDSYIVIVIGHYAGEAAWRRCRGVDFVADARFIVSDVPFRLSCEGISLCESLGLPARGALLD